MVQTRVVLSSCVPGKAAISLRGGMRNLAQPVGHTAYLHLFELAAEVEKVTSATNVMELVIGLQIVLVHR